MLPGIEQTTANSRTSWKSRITWPLALCMLAACMLVAFSVYVSSREEPTIYRPVLHRQYFQSLGLPQRTLAEVVELPTASHDQPASNHDQNQRTRTLSEHRHERPAPTPASQPEASSPSTLSVENTIPAATTQITQNTQPTQRTAENPSSPVISTIELGQHHATFNNVCFRKDYWDPVKSSTIRGAILFYNVPILKEAEIRRQYINNLTHHWQMNYEFVNQPFPSPNATMYKGNTFFYTLAEDNIAQFYQEVACHMPVLLNQQYRQSVGYDNRPWNHFYAHHIAFDSKPASNLTWCPAQMKWLVEATQDLQPNTKISVHDFDEIEPQSRYLKSRDDPIACFDSVTIYQPGSCHLLNGPYPAGTNDTYAHIMRYTKKQLQLAEYRPCASSLVIYDRFNAIRRRLMNGADLKKFIENKLKHRPNTKPVTIQHIQSLPDSIIDQAKLYNDADIFIEPHSASNYNAWFMQDNSAHLELGEHGTWFGKGMAPYITTGLFYKKYDFGWDLLPWDPKFDNLEFAGERSFRATPELMEAIWADISPRFCNVTG